MAERVPQAWKAKTLPAPAYMAILATRVAFVILPLVVFMEAHSSPAVSALTIQAHIAAVLPILNCAAPIAVGVHPFTITIMVIAYQLIVM